MRKKLLIVSIIMCCAICMFTDSVSAATTHSFNVQVPKFGNINTTAYKTDISNAKGVRVVFSSSTKNGDTADVSLRLSSFVIATAKGIDVSGDKGSFTVDFVPKNVGCSSSNATYCTVCSGSYVTDSTCINNIAQDYSLRFYNGSILGGTPTLAGYWYFI